MMKKLLLLSLSFISFTLFSADDGRGVEPASAFEIQRKRVRKILETAGSADMHATAKAAEADDPIFLRFRIGIDAETGIDTYQTVSYPKSRLIEFSSFINKTLDEENFVDIPALPRTINKDNPEKIFNDEQGVIFSAHGAIGTETNPIPIERFYHENGKIYHAFRKYSKADFDALLNGNFSAYISHEDRFHLFKLANYLGIKVKGFPENNPTKQMLLSVINNEFKLNVIEGIPINLINRALSYDLKSLNFLMRLRQHKQDNPEYQIQRKTMAEIAIDIYTSEEDMISAENIPNGFTIHDLIFCGLMPTVDMDRRLDLGYMNISSLEGLSEVVRIRKLHYLRLKHNPLTALPDFIRQLTQLQTLDLNECSSLTALPNAIGQLIQLQSLNLSDCHSLTTLPDSIDQLVQLTGLNLSNCHSLTALPNAIGQLIQLQSLNLYGCHSLTTLPDSIGQLVQLTGLNLSDCHSLTALPDSIGQLVQLTGLNLSDCHSLTALPNSIGQLVNLSFMHLFNCRSLITLPDSIGQLVKLTNLDVSNCSFLSTLPDSIGQLVQLITLSFRGCSSLIKLPDSINKLVQLSLLNLFGCTALKILPNSIINLQNLRNLYLTGTGLTEEIVNDLRTSLPNTEISFYIE